MTPLEAQQQKEIKELRQALMAFGAATYLDAYGKWCVKEFAGTELGISDTSSDTYSRLLRRAGKQP